MKTNRALICTIGTRGDIEPYIHLARGLRQHGWHVAIATHESFRTDVEGVGAEYFRMPGDPAAILNSPQMRQALQSGSTMQMIKVMKSESEARVDENFECLWLAASSFKPTILLGTIVLVPDTISVAQKLNLVAIICSTIPILPTKYFAPVGLPKPSYGSLVNSGLFSLLASVQWSIIGSKINILRAKTLALPPLPAFPALSAPYLMMFSAKIAPSPPDWPKWSFTAGYWVEENPPAFQPSKDLEEFLAAGDAPMYFGFGSMPVVDEDKLIQCVSEAVSKLQRRAIICSGWADVSAAKLPANSLLIKGAPHNFLFPRCCVAVHHGGAGTTAAAAHAGIPQIIYPVLADQPFWAQRVAACGIGPRTHVALVNISPANIVTQLKEALSEATVKNAKQMGEGLRKERGVESAISVIEKYVEERSNNLPMVNWEEDRSVQNCPQCEVRFFLFTRKHHCRACGKIFCKKCLAPYPLLNYPTQQLTCATCRCSLARAAPPSLPLPSSSPAMQVASSANAHRLVRQTIAEDKNLKDALDGQLAGNAANEIDAEKRGGGGGKGEEEEEGKEEERKEEEEEEEQYVGERVSGDYRRISESQLVGKGVSNNNKNNNDGVVVGVSTSDGSERIEEEQVKSEKKEEEKMEEEEKKEEKVEEEEEEKKEEKGAEEEQAKSEKLEEETKEERNEEEEEKEVEGEQKKESEVGHEEEKQSNELAADVSVEEEQQQNEEKTDEAEDKGSGDAVAEEEIVEEKVSSEQEEDEGKVDDNNDNNADERKKEDETPEQTTEQTVISEEVSV